MRTLYLQDEVWLEKVLKKLRVFKDFCPDGVFGKRILQANQGVASKVSLYVTKYKGSQTVLQKN